MAETPSTIRERKPLPPRSGKYHINRQKAENKMRARGKVREDRE